MTGERAVAALYAVGYCWWAIGWTVYRIRDGYQYDRAAQAFLGLLQAIVWPLCLVVVLVGYVAQRIVDAGDAS